VPEVLDDGSWIHGWRALGTVDNRISLEDATIRRNVSAPCDYNWPRLGTFISIESHVQCRIVGYHSADTHDYDVIRST
jgi:hypothetical protein